MCRFQIERISDRPQGSEIIQTMQVRRSNYLHPFVVRLSNHFYWNCSPHSSGLLIWSPLREPFHERSMRDRLGPPLTWFLCLFCQFVFHMLRTDLASRIEWHFRSEHEQWRQPWPTFAMNWTQNIYGHRMPECFAHMIELCYKLACASFFPKRYVKLKSRGKNSSIRWNVALLCIRCTYSVNLWNCWRVDDSCTPSARLTDTGYRLDTNIFVAVGKINENPIKYTLSIQR